MSSPADAGPRPLPRRTVKPRRPTKLDHPIIAVDGSKILLETGEIHSYSELPKLVASQPPSIIVVEHASDMVRELDEVFDPNPLWQFRATPVKREAWNPNPTTKRRATIRETTISFFGFKDANKGKGHYHYPISPQAFCMKSINELIPGPKPRLYKLMDWGKDIRDFLQANELALKPTSGGIAAQLLKDKRFYPNDRRKAPKLTNAFARERLPGNYYRLYEASEGFGGYRASYLDQTAAHHSAARDLEFPCVNTLRRGGRYATLKDLPFARQGTPKYDTFIRRPGLFYLAIESPRFFKEDFPLPESELQDSTVSYRTGYFFSNEIPYLIETGVRIRHIIAHWTSDDVETGLNKYAEWALEEIADSEADRKVWLKPTLLAGYGMLATKPKKHEFGYKRALGGTTMRYPCGSGFITVQAKRMKIETEMPIVNVIHRGMIEAETRLRSLKLARQLAHEGHTILGIYADSLFVADGKPLPLLAHPWRVQEQLTRLRFESATCFTSAQLTKQPGVPLHLRNRARIRGNWPSRPKAA